MAIVLAPSAVRLRGYTTSGSSGLQGHPTRTSGAANVAAWTAGSIQLRLPSHYARETLASLRLPPPCREHYCGRTFHRCSERIGLPAAPQTRARTAASRYLSSPVALCKSTRNGTGCAVASVKLANALPFQPTTQESNRLVTVLTRESPQDRGPGQTRPCLRLNRPCSERPASPRSGF